MKRINTVVTRYPNLECGFFAALMSFVHIRRQLGITRGRLHWEFVSTATRKNILQRAAEKFNTIFFRKINFNVGGGKWDQHGKEENESLCEICSLDLVRGEYDFLKHRSWLKKIFQLVRANDIHGERISRHPMNLRELMSGLTIAYPNNPQLVLDWLTLAFRGVFALLKQNPERSIKKIFDPDTLSEGVAMVEPDKLQWFDELKAEAGKTITAQWAWAENAVEKALANQHCQAEVQVPGINRPVKVLSLTCDSVKTGAAGRKAGYDIIVQWNTDGHCQIHGGTIHQDDQKIRIDLSAVASVIRMAEARLRKSLLASKQTWFNSGVVKMENGETVPWYLPEYRTALYNGSLSSPDVATTRIFKTKLTELIGAALPESSLLREIAPGAGYESYQPVVEKNHDRQAHSAKQKPAQNQTALGAAIAAALKKQAAA